MPFQIQLLVLISCLVSVRSSPITDPLPSEPSLIKSKDITCPTGKPFQWSKADPQGKDIAVEYKCGGAGATKVLKLECMKGYKATYRKDLIPKNMDHKLLEENAKRASIAANQEPNFGLFSSGKSFEVLDKANLVYACIKSK